VREAISEVDAGNKGLGYVHSSLRDENPNHLLKTAICGCMKIYDLKLPVELVVLGACSTCLGKEVRGEGLVGMTRGFMCAGSSRVIASLWKVDDGATSELMAKFYRLMLKNNLRHRRRSSCRPDGITQLTFPLAHLPIRPFLKVFSVATIITEPKKLALLTLLRGANWQNLRPKRI
jgi:hypothetical protein